MISDLVRRTKEQSNILLWALAIAILSFCFSAIDLKMTGEDVLWIHSGHHYTVGTISFLLVFICAIIIVTLFLFMIIVNMVRIIYHAFKDKS